MSFVAWWFNFIFQRLFGSLELAECSVALRS